MGDYQDVLKRLVAYRKKMGMTQTQIGQNLGLSQEQYSYLENGITKISDKNLKELLKCGWSIEYIITGSEFDSSRTELNYLFEDIEDEQLRNVVMKVFAKVLVENGKRYDWRKRSDRVEADLNLLEAIVRFWDSFSMSLFVRNQMNLLQIEMAERLGVGIKKYREIEKENRYPDAEMLLSLYNMSGYSPLFFMNCYDRRLMSMQQVWNVMTEEEKKKQLALVDKLELFL